jgi:histidine phosphotransfer protein HptB
MVELGWNREFALEQAGEDEDLLQELLVLLRDSSSVDLELIRNGLIAGDGQAIGQAAHSLKGAAVSLGIEGLALLAREIEMAGMAGDLVFILSRIEELEIMVRQLAEI